jgi:5-methylthioadenosine/S-adenosylhomocysteine deaminase
VANEFIVKSKRVLLPATEAQRIQPASILVSGGRIAEVIRDGRPAAPGTTVRDYGDHLVSPAFVNAHTHLAMNFMRGCFADLAASENAVENLFFRVESALTPEDVRAFTRMGAYECLQAGVGLVWDHFYFGAAVAAGMRDVGLAAVVAPTLQDLHGPGVALVESELTATLDIAADSGLADAGIFAALGPHATDTVSPSLWSRLAALAESQDLPLHFHLAQSAEEVVRVRSGPHGSPVDLLRQTGILALAQPTMAAHGIFLSLAEAKEVTTGSKKRLVFCPFSQLQFAWPARIDRWVDAGIPFVVGSDAGNCNDGLSVQKELRLVAGFRTLSVAFGAAVSRLMAGECEEGAAAAAGERAEAVRARETLGRPAFLLGTVLEQPGAMHTRFRAGVIDEGALANLAVWDLDAPALWPASDPLRALAFGDTSQALVQLYVAGRPVAANGCVRESILRSEEYREASAEAKRRLEDLWRRVGP